MRTYRELFRTPEFLPFFTTVSVQVAAQTASGPGHLFAGHRGFALPRTPLCTRRIHTMYSPR
ncbi:hypothetical protein AB0O63_23925, partial [Streptomyces cyaneofuscatus]